MVLGRAQCSMVWPIEDQAHHLHLAGCAILSLGDLKSGDEGRAVDQLMTVRLQKGSLWGQVLQPDASHDGGAADEGIGRVAHAFMLLVELCKLRRDNALAVLDLLGEPGVLESLRSRDPVFRVLGEQLLAEVLGRLRDALPLSIAEVVLALHILVQDLGRAVSLKKRSARQNDVEDDADTENVRLAVVSFLLEQFGGDVAGAAAPQVELLRVVIDDGRQAEVSYLQVPVVLLGR